MNSNPANRLTELIEQPGLLILPGAYDCLSARLVEQAGFPALFTSGFGISASLLGRPDFGFLTATEMLTVAGNITASVDIPVVADMDTGYGSPLNVIRTVQDAVRRKVAGVILEDQEWPKKCGHFRGKRVISQAEHVEKIHAAVEARRDSGLIIIGRTDARACNGLDDAIRRGHAYFEAGADVIFVEAPQSAEELHTIVSSFPGIPCMANMIEGGRTPQHSAAQLQELGFKIVAFPLTGLFAATQAMKAAFDYLQEQGTTRGLSGGLTFRAFEEVINLEEYRRSEARFTPKM